MTPELFYKKKLFVKILQYSQENTCDEISLLKRDSNQMFSCEYWENSKNPYFEEHLHMAASQVNLGNNCLGLPFQNHPYLVTLQKYQSLSNQSFKHNLTLTTEKPNACKPCSSCWCRQ